MLNQLKSISSQKNDPRGFSQAVKILVHQGKAMGGRWNAYGYDIRLTREIPFESTSPYIGFR